MDFSVSLGFNPVERERIDHPTAENIQGDGGPLHPQGDEQGVPLPVDGLVIAYDDTVYAATGSVTGHHATRAGYAFKWQDTHADTTWTT